MEVKVLCLLGVFSFACACTTFNDCSVCITNKCVFILTLDGKYQCVNGYDIGDDVKKIYRTSARCSFLKNKLQETSTATNTQRPVATREAPNGTKFTLPLQPSTFVEVATLPSAATTLTDYSKDSFPYPTTSRDDIVSTTLEDSTSLTTLPPIKPSPFPKRVNGKLLPLTPEPYPIGMNKSRNSQPSLSSNTTTVAPPTWTEEVVKVSTTEKTALQHIIPHQHAVASVASSFDQINQTAKHPNRSISLSSQNKVETDTWTTKNDSLLQVNTKPISKAHERLSRDNIPINERAMRRKIKRDACRLVRDFLIYKQVSNLGLSWIYFYLKNPMNLRYDECRRLLNRNYAKPTRKNQVKKYNNA